MPNDTAEKWSLGRAALYGLLVQTLALVASGLQDNWKDVILWSHGTPGEMIGHFGGELLAGPLLFVLIAAVRNWIVKKRS